MKGNNSLHLNEATMIEAVQEYLNARMLSAAPKVTSVKAENSSAYSATFIVNVEEMNPTP